MAEKRLVKKKEKRTSRRICITITARPLIKVNNKLIPKTEEVKCLALRLDRRMLILKRKQFDHNLFMLIEDGSNHKSTKNLVKVLISAGSTFIYG